MRYAARRDGNAGVILDALRKAGFTVMDFSLAGQGIPDALVTRALPDGTPWVCWVEVKMPKGRLKTAQEAFRDVFEPRGEHYVARDAEAAIRELYARYTAAIRPEQLR
jgi:hypothetical protein